MDKVVTMSELKGKYIDQIICGDTIEAPGVKEAVFFYFCYAKGILVFLFV